MNGITITSNQWNQLKQLYVVNVPWVYLLGLSASNWPNNCKIKYYDDANELKEVVDKIINYRFNNK